MTAPWTESIRTMVGFDLETTGVDVLSDRIVTASVVTVSPGVEPAVHEWLVNPGVEINADATAVHGVTTEYAREHGGAPAVAIDAITSTLVHAADFGGMPGGLPVPVVAFNAPFDLSMLRAECRRHGVAPIVRVWPVIDPLVIDKAMDRFRPGKRTLAAMCATYGVRHDDAHQSTGDVMGALRLVWAMARLAELAITHPDEVEGHYAGRRHPGELVRAWGELGRMSIGEIHDAQVGWAAEAAESFRSYLIGRDERDRAATVCGDWPIRLVP